MQAPALELPSFEARRLRAELLRMRSIVPAAHFFCVRVLRTATGRVGKGATRRAHVSLLHFIPVGFASAQPTLRSFRMDCRIKSGNDEGKKKQRRRNAGRREVERAASQTARAELRSPSAADAARPSGTARLSAFHRGACGSEPTPPLSSRRTSWDAAKTRALSASACPSPATLSQAGRDAGRALSRSRPGAKLTRHGPREPHSPRQPASPAAVLSQARLAHIIRNGDSMSMKM
jgi:hypothetical protein